jgi:hypothetical protein
MGTRAVQIGRQGMGDEQPLPNPDKRLPSAAYWPTIRNKDATSWRAGPILRDFGFSVKTMLLERDSPVF